MYPLRTPNKMLRLSLADISLLHIYHTLCVLYSAHVPEYRHLALKWNVGLATGAVDTRALVEFSQKEGSRAESYVTQISRAWTGRQQDCMVKLFEASTSAQALRI